MNSGLVRSLASNCHQLLAPAQDCSDKMSAATLGISDYWVNMGGEEFKQHCTEWINKMNQFKAAIAQIESEMMSYATELQRIEEEEAARVKEAQRQANDKAAAEAAAAAIKAGKIK